MKSLEQYIARRRRKRVIYFLGFLVLILVLGFKVDFSLSKIYRGMPNMLDLFQRILRPNPAYIGEVFGKLVETLEIAFASSLTGVVLALPFSILLAENVGPSKALASILRGVFAFVRTIPSLIWAALLVSIFSVGKFSGILALAIIAFLMSLKLFREYIESIEENQLDSIRTVGGSSPQVLRYAVLPQLGELIISVFFTVLETNVRSATILGLVGAGGIGQIMWRDLNHLRYDNLSTLILILFITILLIDLISLQLRKISSRASINIRTLDGYKKYKLSKLILLPIFGIILFYFIIRSFNISHDRLILGLNQGKIIIGRIIRPDWSYLPKLLEGIGESFFIAIFATLMGALASIFLSYFAAYNLSPNPKLAWIFKGLINIFRTFPPIITAIIFFRGVGPGPLSGAIALTIYTTGVLTKLYSELLETTRPDRKNSILVTGASNFQSYRYGLIPHTLPTFISLVLYRLESNIRNSTILGVIGAGGIGTILSMNITWRNWEQVGLLLLGISLMVIGIDQFSNYIRKKVS